jgi:hypothetical protein
MIPDASPFWQNAFLVGVFVIFGWGVWNGWRLGIVRALWSLLAMSAAGAAAVVAMMLVGGITLKVAPTFGAMVGTAAAALVALVIYFAVSFLGGLLFKRTAQQPTSALRLVYGLGGALLGAVFGVCVLWGVLLFVRGLGGFCEGTVASTDGIYTLPMPEPAARALVKLKKSIEAGGTGKILKSIDVMPAEFYEVLDKLGKLIADPEAMRRFITYPGVNDVLVDAHFLGLVQDPEVQEIARSQDGASLIKHPKMLEAVKDPGLLAKLQKIDINKALDYALTPPKAGATPAPTPHISTP